MSFVLDHVGGLMARYLDRGEADYTPFTPSDPDALRAVLRPGDVLLVEGTNKISGIIKYLTQSTWSHAALYTGPVGDRTTAEASRSFWWKPISARASSPRRCPNISSATPASAGRPA